MNALSLMVQKLWSRLKFSKWRSKVTVKVTRSKYWYRWKGLVTRIHMSNMKALSPTVQKLWPRLKFSKCRSKVTVTRSKVWYWLKGLVTRNIHVKYESPICYGSKVMTKVKVFSQTDRQIDRELDDIKISKSNNSYIMQYKVMVLVHCTSH